MTWPENRFAYAEISAAALGWDCVIETHLWKIHNVNDPIELYTLFVNKNCQQKQISCSMNQSALSKCDTVKKEFSKHRHDIVSSLPFSKIRKIGPVRKYRIKKIFERVFFLILPQNMHNTFNSFIFQVSQRNWYYLLSLHSTHFHLVQNGSKDERVKKMFIVQFFFSPILWEQSLLFVKTTLKIQWEEIWVAKNYQGFICKL